MFLWWKKFNLVTTNIAKKYAVLWIEDATEIYQLLKNIYNNIISIINVCKWIIKFGVIWILSWKIAIFYIFALISYTHLSLAIWTVRMWRSRPTLHLTPISELCQYTLNNKSKFRMNQSPWHSNWVLSSFMDVTLLHWSGKVTDVSSVGYNRNGSKAIDGDINTFMHTADSGDPYPWFKLDMEAEQLVLSVSVQTRAFWNGSRKFKFSWMRLLFIVHWSRHSREANWNVSLGLLNKLTPNNIKLNSGINKGNTLVADNLFS